jgi:acetoacetyl-CoA synthetase
MPNPIWTPSAETVARANMTAFRESVAERIHPPVTDYASLYRIVEKLGEIAESIAVGREWENDVRGILFVKLKPGSEPSPELRSAIQACIRANASPRHVPAKIIQVAGIPRTINNKITELAVRDVIRNRPVRNTEGLLNPEALELYRNLEELAT